MRKTAPTPAGAESSVGVEPSWAPRHFALILVVMGVVALAWRGAVVYDYVQRNPLAGTPINDAETYWAWAERVAAGHLLQEEPFFSAPLYPYLLGLVRVGGGGLAAVYVLQVLLDLATAGLLGCVGRKRFGALTGLLATAVFLLLQEPVSASLRVLPGSLHLLLVTVTWAALLAAQARASVGRLLASGATLGLLCLAYAPALLLVVPVAAVLFLHSPRRRRDLWRTVVPLAAAGAVIAPATVHNWHACGELFWVQAVSGVTLRLGNHPGANGAYAPLPEMSVHRKDMHADAARMYRVATGEQPSWKKVDRYFREETYHYWRDHPLPALKLAARKAYYFLSSRNYSDIYQPRAEIDAGWGCGLRWTPLPVPWVLGPALLGFGLLLRHPGRYAPELLLFAVPLVTVVLFWYSPRFRLPAVPMMVIAAAWAVTHSMPWRARPVLASTTGALLAVSILLGFVNRAQGFDEPDPAALRFHLAYALDQQGRTAEAIAQQQQGVSLRPADVYGQRSLAELLIKAGRPVEALVPLQRARILAPADARVRRDLARTLFQLRRFDEAEPLLAEAAAQDPNDAGSLSLLAGIRQLRGQREEACALYEQALDADPAAVVIRYAYANLLLRLERPDDARRQFEWVLRLDPRHVGALHNLGMLALQRDDYASARTHLEQALALNPNEVAVLHGLGVACVGLGERERGAEYFRRALAIDPKYVPSREALERLDEAAARPTPQNPP
ncbi:MAG TPA: tetratricopeptide repeat protein [Phycisphaerae bacterium]|nr:tetratricopeptide repeat protein [Phycisphaerae bacterium]HNU45028.1 tetratricopeptide repeat protein [Phycisphaerae bacterium]